MTICGECDNCGANHVAVNIREERTKDGGADLTRVCGICGHEMDAGYVTKAQYECAHYHEDGQP